MDTIYTENQIESAWTIFKTESVLKCEKYGKTHIKPLTGEVNLDGCTSAEHVKLSTVMEFPEFLRKNYG